MGDPIPLGPIPKGCAKLEVIIGRLLRSSECLLKTRLIGFN
jgi:hypothetical protein